MSGDEAEKISAFARLYEKAILHRPLVVVAVFAAGLAFFGYNVSKFRMDASSDSLVLENDADLHYYETTREIFGSDDYVVLATTLDRYVFSDEVLRTLDSLSRDLSQLNNVASVNSILTVPLFQSPKVSLYEMGTNYKTLLAPGCDRDLAYQELTTSPLWRNNLLSADGKTTSIVLTFKPDTNFSQLRDERYQLRRKRASGNLTPDESTRLRVVTRQYEQKHAELSAQRREDIGHIRAILSRYRRDGYEFVESGVPMIIADMVTYIERDLFVFGIGLLLFLTLVLAILFRKVQWVLLPLVTCLIPVVFMMGYLGLTSWKTTVVSANFSSLLLIISMQNAIYLIVRFREIHARFPDKETRAILFQTVREISVPCFYTSATAIAGFSTLALSGIRPVIDFGILMGVGVAVAYVITFTFFPAAILFFPKGAPPPAHLATLESSPVAFLAAFSQRNVAIIVTGSVIVGLVALVGITKLQVENRFIDYFRRDTPISRGLTLIDERLGGTTSLEVVLPGEQKDHWLEPQNLATLRKIHKHLEAQPDVGKVSSLDTLIEILTKVNDGTPPNRLVLNLARASLSPEMQNAYVLPYVNRDFSIARIFVRIRESSPTLSRDAMLNELRTFLQNEVGLSEDRARITGLFVLYNNLLKSLFDSQIKTVGVVFVVIYMMLVALFRSFYLALISMVPTTLPILMVLGTMGLLRISLDMMTIMIASVTMGIAVDNMIQYTFRHRAEFHARADYSIATQRTHNSIGLAILYSNFTIIAGFGILALSNFLPTVYFGVFTSLAMAAGFLGSLTLLPMLLIVLKPYGRAAATVRPASRIARQ